MLRQRKRELRTTTYNTQHPIDAVAEAMENAFQPIVDGLEKVIADFLK